MMNAQKIAAAYFPHYPSVNELHITTDGQVFEVQASAFNHAKSLNLENPVVETVTRAAEPGATVTDEGMEETEETEAPAPKKGKAKK
jgi:hypothetical protein